MTCIYCGRVIESDETDWEPFLHHEYAGDWEHVAAHTQCVGFNGDAWRIIIDNDNT
mgnify:CR=1 FL=1